MRIEKYIALHHLKTVFVTTKKGHIALNTMDVSSGARTVYPSEAPESRLCFVCSMLPKL